MSTSPPDRSIVWKRVAIRIGRIAALVFVLIAVAIRLFAGRLVFAPDRYAGDRRAPPTPEGFEDVWLTGDDGVRIHAWMLSPQDARCTLLYFHGNAGNLDYRSGWIRRLSRIPANVLAVEYRGYGRSEGRPTEEGICSDAVAAWEYLTGERGIRPEHIVIYGKSLGGGPACELATRVSCAGLILQSTFTSIPDMAGRVLPWFPGGWFVPVGFDNEAKLRTIDEPVLIIHSRGDEMIPFAMAERLHAAAVCPGGFEVFERSRHNDLIGEHGGDVVRSMEAFIARNVPQVASHEDEREEDAGKRP